MITINKNNDGVAERDLTPTELLSVRYPSWSYDDVANNRFCYIEFGDEVHVQSSNQNPDQDIAIAYQGVQNLLNNSNYNPNATFSYNLAADTPDDGLVRFWKQVEAAKAAQEIQ